MKRGIIKIGLVLVLILCFSACRSAYPDKGVNSSNMGNTQTNAKTNMKDGSYHSPYKDISDMQSININTSDKSISYSSSPLSSYLALGIYDLKDDILSFTDDLGKEYKITILEEGNLKYKGTTFYYDDSNETLLNMIKSKSLAIFFNLKW